MRARYAMDQQSIFASVGPAASDDRISGSASAREVKFSGCSTSTNGQDEVVIAMDKVTVYRFQIWDQNIGKNVWGPRMATVWAIQRVNGAVDEATAQLVDRSALDGNGFYPAKPPR